MGQDWKRLHELRGVWKFSIGDKKEWAEQNFDDSEWEDIFVPSSWEDEGYPGYNGYAWYRKSITFEKKAEQNNLYLRLGYIDDVDQVFINGHLVGFSGSFPPFYYTAYNSVRSYRIPDSVLNIHGKNVIAVRIFDRQLAGGIVKGNCGIYEKRYNIKIEISLEGYWKFKTGDRRKYKKTDYSDHGWRDLFVPDIWERQGIFEYDGYAWYRKKFIMPEEYIGERLILLLGKIDDLDETFFNGMKIGETGRLYEEPFPVGFEDEWLVLRAYEIDENHIIYGGKNLIAVRVFDGMLDGGIYDGPVGIVTYKNFKKWQLRSKSSDKGFFEWLFGEY